MATLEKIVVVLNNVTVNPYRRNYNLIPMKLIKAIPIKPVIINVIPKPLKAGPGTCGIPNLSL